MAVGWEGGGDGGDGFLQGQAFDSGKDEGLQFGVGGDLAGHSGPMGAAMGGKDFLTVLLPV